MVAGGENPSPTHPQATAERWSWGVLRDGAGEMVGPDGREHDGPRTSTYKGLSILPEARTPGAC